MKDPHARDYVQSLERGFLVLLAFSEHRPRMSLGEVATCTGLSRPTVRRILLTLEKLGYVRSNGRSFSLTPHVLSLGNAYLSSLDLTEVSQPFMEYATKVTGQTISLAVLEGDEAVFINRVQTRKVMRHTLTTGTKLPAFATSMGRMLLAELPEHEIEDFLSRGPFPNITARTVTDPVELRAILSKTRERGWALVDQEFEEGVRSFSAPIRDFSNYAIATISMSVTASTYPVDTIRDDLVPVVLECAQRISKELGAPIVR